MESLSEMVVEKSGKFLAVGDGARFVGEILEDQASIVGSAKEGAIDASRAALDDRARCPNESNAEEGAESHAKLRVTCEETREETSEEEDGKKGADEKKDVVAALNQDITSAAAKKSRDLQDAVFNDSVGEGKRIEEKDKEGERIVEPGRGL
jgi:hypothetical protein